jgi:hypothetical protein
VAARFLPVVLVHGYAEVCPATDVKATWYVLIGALRSHGWRGPFDALQYYACDSNFDVSIDGDGAHTAYFGDVHAPDAGGRQSHSQDTDVRHLAYHFAWYVYDTYTSHGRSVGVVAHSMGGILVRWALAQVDAHDAAFPPRLDVHDVITFGTPFDGAPIAASIQTTQGREIGPGSDFIRALRALPPPARTNWTVVGSERDELVPAASATDLSGAHAVVYPGISHAGYLVDDRGGLTGVERVDPGGHRSASRVPHPARLADLALSGRRS